VDDLRDSNDHRVRVKYGSMTAWGNQTVKRLKSWAFNTIAEYASIYVIPLDRPIGAELLPMAGTMRPSFYGLTNTNHYAPGPFKGLVDSQHPRVYTGWWGGDTPDVFDANFEAYVLGNSKATKFDPFWSQTLTSRWVIGSATDDADDLQGFGPGLEIPGSDGYVSVHIGWLALSANPSRAVSEKYKVTYKDPKVYAKYALRDFLAERYHDSIAALNAAWGSSYTTFDSAGGWGRGTGLLDENGRHTAWLGRTDGTLRDASPGVARDLDDFLYKFAEKYFAVTAGNLRKFAPHHLIFGPATLNGHGGLTRKQILQAAGKYVDVLQAGITDSRVLEKTAEYAGDKPIVTWEGGFANPDSSLWRYPNPVPGPATQAARGQKYAERVRFLFNAQTSTGSNPIVGFKWWAWCDAWAEKANWGLTSLLDNAYDGKEAVVARRTDSWNYPTGGEERNYGDFISYVRQANSWVTKRLQEELQLAEKAGTHTPNATKGRR
jgi:hypothetical protein